MTFLVATKHSIFSKQGSNKFDSILRKLWSIKMKENGNQNFPLKNVFRCNQKYTIDFIFTSQSHFF